MNLDDRVAVVTGGSRGIGRATALALAADGARVAVNYRSGKDEAHDVVAEIEAAGGRAAAFAADVSDYEQARALMAEVLDTFGDLHILVNNAGVSKDNLIYHMDPQDWMDVMRVNFGGVFNCTKAALDHFMVTRDAAIVNVSSVMGERGWTGESNYAASKGAVDAFTRSAAVELARFRVRVNAVLPGFAPTDLVADLSEGDVAKHLKRQIPMRDFATVEQVASGIRFLAGPESEYMTGVLLNVDGGGMAGLGLGRLKW
ncbi:3-oxoacyl-[acyl-carrier-protein] reductase [Haloactinopolyspora alba]|uniref:3-oxoacyl-[acyl-carrier-protein] reductase n=1 Tax=Haloactinopolyspora alba TaxID=648780 RepID=A0A2P8DYS1_9ACTN|nr:glucose 1-dehydrogenase [Haloactinopolyspora alba]PSL02364.1 3-oxoacyl-[acyl-carrier-protein] reductase [Haloactinopolyspora alba]